MNKLRYTELWGGNVDEIRYMEFRGEQWLHKGDVVQYIKELAEGFNELVAHRITVAAVHLECLPLRHRRPEIPPLNIDGGERKKLYRCPYNAEHDDHADGLKHEPGNCPVCGAEMEFI